VDDNKRNMVHTKTPIVIPSQSRSNQFFIGYNMTTCCKLISAHLHCVHFLRDHQWQSSARINSWGALLVIREKMVTMEVYRLHVYYINFLAVEPTISWECCGNIMMAVFHIFSKQCGSQRLMFVAW
jgi:hypothetical protein